MLRLIESSVASIEQQLFLVAPRQVAFADVFNRVTVDPFRHKQLIREMQRLRGSIYLDEGNVKRHELTADGRHETPEDDKSWHILLTNGLGQIRSCALYLEHEDTASIQDLRVRHCPLIKNADWQGKFKGAVESEMARARCAGVRFAEVGGWAVQKERRGTTDGLMIILATYALSQMLGSALVLTTANVAHSCSAILRRFGGDYLRFEGTSIPAYFDPRYNTEIELVRFDSRRPSTKYASLVDIVKRKLANVSVITNPCDVAMVDRYHTAAVIGMARPMFAA